MLFIESKTSNQSVNAGTRLLMLERLQEKGLMPLIRTARLSCYEQALLGPERVKELERAVATFIAEEEKSAYVLGDVFCFEDFALFLIFSDAENGTGAMRAGIIHQADTTEPLKKLDAFCRNVNDALNAARGRATDFEQDLLAAEWRAREPRVLSGSAAARFAAWPAVEQTTSREITGAQPLAAEVLEDAAARRFLHRIREAHPDGRIGGMLAGDENEGATESLINRLVGAGLLKREVLVSCRKQGRALFRLPSPDALSVITASNAQCSECGATIADEKVEELMKPTETAASLLEDGSWLTGRIHTLLRGMGIPEKQITVEPSATGEGEAYMLIAVGDEPFLFVLRDGDLTTAHARRALDKLIETEGKHLVVISTAKIQDEARARLREHERRNARGGNQSEVVLIEGVDGAATELRQAFERVSERSLIGELCALDASLGISVGYMLAARFRLTQRTGELQDLAASAVGALAGSLRGF